MAVCAAMLIWGGTKMKRKVNLLIGIVLCLIMVLTSMMSVMAETGNPGETAPGTETGAVQEELKTDDSTATDSKAEGEEGSTDAVKNEDDAIAEDKASAASDAQKLSTEKADRKVFKSAAVSAKEATNININKETNMPQTGWNLGGGTISVSESGIIMSPANAGSHISNGTINVDEDASNSRKAQQTESNGSVICAQTWGLLNLENLTINDNAAKTMAVNLWQNSVVNFNSVNLNGNNKDWENTPVLLGDEGSKISFSSYDEDHTDSSIRNIRNAVIREVGSMSFGVESGSTLTIENSLLTYDGRGGDLVVSGTLTVKGSSLTLNNKRIVVKSGATLEIKDSSSIKQIGNINTAGIKVEKDGKLIIKDSSLVDTWIRNEGTVKVSGSDMNNCVIKNLNSTLSVENSKLHNYKRTTAPNAEGGFDTMIHGTGSEVTLVDTEIYDNENNYDKPSKEGTPGASIISLKGGSITMNKVNAHNNANNSDGGVMHTVDTNVTIENNSTFKDNSAKNQTQKEIDDGQWYAKGGALYIEDDHTTDVKHTTIIKDTTFEGNKATEGGAVFFKSDDQEYGMLAIDITVSTFKNNEARRAGGGLVIWGNGTTAELKGVEFLNNKAANFGGGMAVYFDSDPKGTIITASETASEKRPSKFVGNKVTKGKNFAGGGLFIDRAHVTMEDTAIYNNTAPHAGGGLSTCGVGTLEARVHDGVAIYDNNVRGKHGSLPDGYTLKDVYLRNINNNAILPGDKKDFPDYPYELYERMFNGGLHKWDKKEIQDEGYLQLVAKSDATNKDVSKAKVVFTENEVTATGNEVVSGGGIACNGLLTIGRGTELKAVKIWDDNNNNDGYRPDPNDEDEIDWIKIKADGKEIDLKEYNVEFTVVKGTEADDYVLDNNIAVIDEDGKVTKFSEKYKDLGDNAWLIIIDGDFPRYRDVEKEGGGITHKLINYTVEEDLGKLGSKYSNTKREGGMDSYFELTNSHVDETVEVAGQKTWDDNNNQRGDRPESITVTLFKNGVQVPDAVKTIGESNNWKWDFGEFPKFENGEKISYTVVENAVSDYSVSYNDFNVTNKYTPGMTSVTVVKNWEDKDDADGIRPSSVTVKLLANGKDTGKTLVLSKSNNWIGAFTDLYEKENGKAIVYTVSETAVKGYTSSVSGDQKTGYVITNKHNPKKNGAGSGSSKKGVRTGDANNVLPWIITLAAAAAILGAVIAKRRLNK